MIGCLRLAVAVCAVVFLLAPSAYAYIGPGVGVTMIGWFVGCGVAVVVALWAVISWPLKRLLARMRSEGETGVPAGESDSTGPAAG